MTTRKTSTRRATSRTDEEMRSEYRFDYGEARPNRFASTLKKRRVAVLLDPDVATVFQSSESVNALLRSVISAMPEMGKPESQDR
jgi:hypothetical protein